MIVLQLTGQIFRRNARRGLTFVELLIAVMMVAILFVGLSTHLRAGMTVWERVTQSTDMRQRERASIARLERDLANAFVFDERASAYGPGDGLLSPPALTNTSIAFYSVPTREALNQTPAQYLVYWAGSIGNQSGLWRQRWTIDQSRAKRGADPELILPECEGIRFSYAYLRSEDASQQSQPLDWQSSWQETPKALPRLVGVEFKLAERQRIRGVTTTVHRTLQRVALIPAGVLRAPQQSTP